ncbi:MAG: RagB/SusD family nutrient uptake outer membrane protein [Flammeovirgaceae bacterium]|nr:RagB/SusD family nutrient uptake outer membrane protein [Flammeovirgaceae bacterium]MBE60926.1 RagB/SusD family nutrient uptake outer membrane protein [Flammeovirgaceae bacterium]HCX23942.1 RagB/SusD family nutrient uptake outer membrane protein [Cytophagales bacterium]|tara:strand:- start:4372 stop:6030 length:1659 start_codon:yes stop_codon:yes gene_type:complete
MKNQLIYLSLIISFLGFSCEDALEETPFGEIAPANMTDPANVEGVIISAYSVLNGQFDQASSAYNSPASNWSFGDVMSDDAYKGGGGTGDQNQIHLMETFNINSTIYDIQRKWAALYEGVKRSNVAMQLLDKSEAFDPSLKTVRKAELHFLRGHYYFELKRIYHQIPYIDESATLVDDYYKSNTEFTSDELWEKIEQDFMAAYNGLPSDQDDAGRPNKITAMAYLAKCYAYQSKWDDVLDATEEVISSGKYELLPNFRDVFLPENDNSSEIIFAVQQAVNDATPNNYNGSIGDRLSAPGGPRYPQYGFHRPSQNLINAFKTDANGQPVMDNVDVVAGDYLDPRLDHTVGRPDIPYLDLGIVYEAVWARDLATYGPFSPKKRIVSPNNSLQTPTWPYVSALNYYIIRYPDLLLWRAEALVATSDLEGARAIVNQIRQRAKDSQVVMSLDGLSPADNYLVEPYSTVWTDAPAALSAVRLERRLELAMEGHRFFDLVRWGVAAKTMNDYFDEERNKRSFLSNASFNEGVNEYFPIPQAYIDVVGTELAKQRDGFN